MKPKPTTQMSYNYFISDSSTCNVLDSTSNPISSMYVYLNGANNWTTNSNGQKFIYFNDVNCDIKNGKNNSGYYFDTVTGTYQEMDLAQNSVNHFISVVTPGALDGSSGGIDLFKDHMDDAVSRLREKDINHTTVFNLRKGLLSNCFLDSSSTRSLIFCAFYWVLNFEESNDNIKMSVNVLENYYFIAKNNSDPQPVDNLSLNTFTLIDGDYVRGLIYNDGSNDELVPTNDGDQIFDLVSSSNKTHYRINEYHSKIIKEPITYKIIYHRLNNISEDNEGGFRIG